MISLITSCDTSTCSLVQKVTFHQPRSVSLFLLCPFLWGREWAKFSEQTPLAQLPRSDQLERLAQYLENTSVYRFTDEDFRWASRLQDGQLLQDETTVRQEHSGHVQVTFRPNSPVLIPPGSIPPGSIPPGSIPPGSNSFQHIYRLTLL